MTKKELIEELRSSRVAITADARKIRDTFSISRRAQGIVKEKPIAWVGGAAAVGFILSLLSRRPRKIVVQENKEIGASGKKLNRKTRKEAAKQAKAVESAKKLTLWGFLLAVVKLLLPALRPAVTAWTSKLLADTSSQYFAKEDNQKNPL
ncbi:MAG: hypothetical protein ACK5NG_10190 [Chthoniobacterales bacterium]